MRFYLDEHMPLEATPRYLRRKGHGSVHAVELGHGNRDDEFHYQFAKSEKRIFLSRDEDFRDAQRYPHRKHPGVIVIAVGRSADAAEVIAVLDKVLRLFRTAASLYENKRPALSLSKGHCPCRQLHGADRKRQPRNLLPGLKAIGVHGWKILHTEPEGSPRPFGF